MHEDVWCLWDRNQEGSLTNVVIGRSLKLQSQTNLKIFYASNVSWSSQRRKSNEKVTILCARNFRRFFKTCPNNKEKYLEFEYLSQVNEISQLKWFQRCLLLKASLHSRSRRFGMTRQLSVLIRNNYQSISSFMKCCLLCERFVPFHLLLLEKLRVLSISHWFLNFHRLRWIYESTFIHHFKTWKLFFEHSKIWVNYFIVYFSHISCRLVLRAEETRIR